MQTPPVQQAVPAVTVGPRALRSFIDLLARLPWRLQGAGADPKGSPGCPPPPQAVAGQPATGERFPAEQPAGCAPSPPVRDAGDESPAGIRRADGCPLLPPASAQPGSLEVTFGSGQLAGLVCSLQLSGQAVDCRLRSPGAALRRRLRRLRPDLARRLAAAGLAVDRFEVTP